MQRPECEEIIKAVIADEVPIHSVSIHDAGEVEDVNLEDVGLTALRVEWRQNQRKLAMFVLWPADIKPEAMGADLLTEWARGLRPCILQRYKEQAA